MKRSDPEVRPPEPPPPVSSPAGIAGAPGPALTAAPESVLRAAKAAAAEADAKRERPAAHGGRREGAGRKGADHYVVVGDGVRVPRAEIEQQTTGFLLVTTAALGARFGEHWGMAEPEARAIAASGIRMAEAYGWLAKGIPPWAGFALACLPYTLRVGAGEWAKLRARRAPPAPAPTPAAPAGPKAPGAAAA